MASESPSAALGGASEWGAATQRLWVEGGASHPPAKFLVEASDTRGLWDLEQDVFLTPWLSCQAQRAPKIPPSLRIWEEWLLLQRLCPDWTFSEPIMVLSISACPPPLYPDWNWLPWHTQSHITHSVGSNCTLKKRPLFLWQNILNQDKINT